MLNPKNEKLYKLLDELLSDSDNTFSIGEISDQLVSDQLVSDQLVSDQLADETKEISLIDSKSQVSEFQVDSNSTRSILINNPSNYQDTLDNKPIGLDNEGSDQNILKEVLTNEATNGVNLNTQPNDLDLGGNLGSEINAEAITAEAVVTETWAGGYKVEIDFDTPNSPDGNWNISLDGVDGEVRDIYGLEIIEQSGGNLVVTPESGYKSGEFSSGSGNGVIIFDGSNPTNLSVGNSLSDSLPEPVSNTVDIGDAELDQDLIPDLVGAPVGAPIGGSIDAISSPQSGQFNYGEALQKSLIYFDANESGRISSDNKFDWRGDAVTGVDQGELNQGIHDTYFDAGDHVMFGQPLGYSNFALGFGVNQYRQAYQDSGQLDEVLDVIKRMSDGIMAGHEMNGGKTKSFVAQIGFGGGGANGSHQFWNPAESEQSSRAVSRIGNGEPGTEVAANYAAGLAQAAIAFKGIDGTYSDKLLNNAKALFEYAETYQGKYSDTIPQASPFYKSHSGFADELAAAAGSVYQASGEQTYLDKAQNIFDNNGVGYTDFAPSADNASTMATLILAQESSDPKYQKLFEDWADLWVEGKGAVQHSPGGQAFRQAWGSAVLSSSAAFAIETYADTVNNKAGYSDFATNQIDYVLGDNPRNSSYIVGFGENSPQRPHHRGSAGTQSNNTDSTPNDHILYGALVGGPSAADDYSYNDHRSDHITNEVGVSYNAALSGALVQQFDNFGGDPLSDQQLDDLVGISVEF